MWARSISTADDDDRSDMWPTGSEREWKQVAASIKRNLVTREQRNSSQQLTRTTY